MSIKLQSKALLEHLHAPTLAMPAGAPCDLRIQLRVVITIVGVMEEGQRPMLVQQLPVVWRLDFHLTVKNLSPTQRFDLCGCSQYVQARCRGSFG